ncbi:imidazole glycerol phosphate synthase subunit HisH [Balneola vulgaris]|uniref:imidazole glycerol phosphate synthase subunit HisH n=1 Tax=Balneola vulgaris TaxID=287535 RepID=UPI000381A015|nr:imidazole glycerol phosphate synthase subunit HisH [Balneola vulgaris]
MIGIIDYGVGNIKAFENIYKRLGISCIRVNSVCDINSEIKKYILPGVGSFDHAMNKLRASGLLPTLEVEIINKKKDVLGICVGMQMLAHSSEEGNSPGLGWIEGEVKKLDVNKLNQKTHLPHMGWNSINKIEDPLFHNIPEEARFYFLHSYYFENKVNSNCMASVVYGDKFCCAVNTNNIYGVQFHPEKSHDNGIQLLKNYSNI